MPERRILGNGWTRGVTLWPSLNSPGWRWLTSSLFLTRTSCHKITHANGYYSAWTRWAVSVSVLPLTIWSIILSLCLRLTSVKYSICYKFVSPPKKYQNVEKTFKNFKETKIFFFFMICALLEKNFQTWDRMRRKYSLLFVRTVCQLKGELTLNKGS